MRVSRPETLAMSPGGPGLDRGDAFVDGVDRVAVGEDPTKM